MNQARRLMIEFLPLLAFFVTNRLYGIMTGTAVFMVAAAISVLLSWRFERRIPPMPLIGCGFVLIFGGLTLWLNDDVFIKIKPTVVNLLFAAMLFGGHWTGRSPLRMILGHAMDLDEAGWRILTVRWAWFFLGLAMLNEVVWRSLETDDWVNFKVFGILPLTILFSLAQVRVILRHQTNSLPK